MDKGYNHSYHIYIASITYAHTLYYSYLLYIICIFVNVTRLADDACYTVGIYDYD